MRALFVTSSMVLLVCIGCTRKASVDSANVEAAVTAAETWLQVVDDGQYDQSWETAAAVFKGAVAKPDWSRMLQGARFPLGKVVSRSVTSKEYTRSLPGAPDGEYVVIRFATSFENKESAVETVTPALDKDRAWRVSGYFVK